jgi:hypothetical protein
MNKIKTIADIAKEYKLDESTVKGVALLVVGFFLDNTIVDFV